MYTYNGTGYSESNIIFTESQHLVYNVIYAPEAIASVASRTPLHNYIIIFHRYKVIALQLIKHMLQLSLVDPRPGFRGLRGRVAALPSSLDHCPSHASQPTRTKSLSGRMTMNETMGEGERGLMAAGSGQTRSLLSSSTNGLMWRNRYACLSRISPAGSILSGMPTGRSPCFSTSSVVGPSHSFLISTTPRRSAAKEKCYISLMPFTFLNPADRKVLQSKVGTSTFPASSLTSWDRLAVEHASTSSAMSDMHDTLVRRNLRLMRPKHHSGPNL